MKPIFTLSFVICHICNFSQSWQQQPDFPGLERDDAVATTVNNKAYYGLGFAVGFTCQNDWWSFDKINGWQQKATFPGTARQYAAAAALGKYVYVFGGIDQNLISLNDFWRYDTEKNSWEQLADFPSTGRQAPVLIALYDQLLLGMGRNYEASLYYNDCWMYDPTTNSFEQKSNFPGETRYYPVYSNVGGNAIVAHGKNQTDCFNDCWMYSHDDDQWFPLEYSSHAGCNYISSASSAYNLYLGGGLDSSNEFLSEFYAFNLTENSWISLPDLPSIPRKGASMFVIEEELYVVNGIDSNYNRLNEVWKMTFPVEENIRPEVSPNPASEWLNVYLKEEMRTSCETTVTLSLYDLSGRKTISDKYYTLGSWFPMNISHLKPGLYILNLENCEGISSVKIIKE